MKITFILLISLLSLLAVSVNLKAQAPAYQWINTANANQGFVEASGHVTDSLGNTYLVGNYQGEMSIGSVYMEDVQLNDRTYVVKYDSQGNVIWVRHATSKTRNSVNIYAVALDPAGNIYLGGTYSDSVTFGDTTIFSQWVQGVFITSFSTNGDHRWLLNGHSTMGMQVNALAADKFGNCFFICRAGSDFTIGGHTVADTSFQNFYGRINANGDVAWLKGSKNFYSWHIVADQAGGLIVSGEGNQNMPAPIHISDTVLQTGSYIVNFSPNGNLYQISPTLHTGAIARDKEGFLYIASNFTGVLTLGSFSIASSGAYDLILSKYTQSGALLWAKKMGGSATESCRRIALDKENNIFLSGVFFDGTAQFGSFSFTPEYYDVFVLKTDNLGEVIWAKSISGSYYDEVGGLSIDYAGNCYISGTFYEDVQLDQHQLFSFADNYYIARLGDFTLATEGNKNTVKSNLLSFPNPFNTEITLELPAEHSGKVSITITDALGRTVDSRLLFSVANQVKIDHLSPLNPGFYIISVHGEGMIYQARVSKQ